MLCRILALYCTLQCASALVVKSEEQKCPFTEIATLSSPMYTSHVNRLVGNFNTLGCRMFVHKLDRDIKFRGRKKDENKFQGNGVKISTVLEHISSLPSNSTFLWMDATVILPDEHFPSFEMLELLSDNDIVVAGESGKKKVNIGVLLMKNTVATQEFFRRVLSMVNEGHWDQGVASCLLNKKTKYKCKGISRFRDINYRFFPASIVDVEGIFSSSECRHKIAKMQGLLSPPSIIKLVGIKSPRDDCIHYFDKLNLKKGQTQLNR